MAEKQTRVFGIVPAAGRSRRMGAMKQLLDVGGRSMLLDVIESLAAADVDGIAVVTHGDVRARVDVSHLCNVFLVSNDDPTSEMIDSVRLGLDALHRRFGLLDDDGVLVCPADHPGIDTDDFKTCICAFRDTPDRIIVGARNGRRGHPIILPAALRSDVASDACRDGLRCLMTLHPKRVQWVECQSKGVIRDIDTPEAFDELQGDGSGK